MEIKKVRPAMDRYKELKGKHPDAIALIRVNDWYEIYGQDAEEASVILPLRLKILSKGASLQIKMVHFPEHELDTYLPMLVRAGKRVTISEY